MSHCAMMSQSMCAIGWTCNPVEYHPILIVSWEKCQAYYQIIRNYIQPVGLGLPGTQLVRKAKIEG